MTQEHRFWISIPLNIDDLDNIPDGMAWEDITFEDFEITKEDYENLWNLFASFDAPFGIIIDEYEEEILLARFVKDAVRKTEEYREKSTAAARTSAEKLLQALKRADELGKQVAFFF